MTPNDDRIPVRFVITPPTGSGVALLFEAGRPRPASGLATAAFTPGSPRDHIGCRCCLERSGAARALGQLYLASARGEVPPFSAVAVIARTEAGRDAVADALSADPLARARFRLA